MKPLTTLTPSLLRGPGRVLHLLDGPLGLLLGVAPGGGRYPVVGAGVVVVEHKLAGQVVRDRPAFQPVLAEQLMTPLAIARVAQGLLHVEVVAPARKLDAVIAPLAGLLAMTSSVRSAHWPVKSVTGRAMLHSPKGFNSKSKRCVWTRVVMANGVDPRPSARQRMLGRHRLEAGFAPPKPTDSSEANIALTAGLSMI